MLLVFFIDTYITVRYTNYIEVRCIALKGLNYGRTYKKSLCSDDGDRVLHLVMPAISESRVWSCTEGKRNDRQ